ncbi:hypothetical protein AB5I41_06660 [Sphingomonas sp. MMS24-JH45]
MQEGAMLHSDPGAPLSIGEDCTIGHHAILHADHRHERWAGRGRSSTMR